MPTSAANGGGGGLLQGFRRKIGRYGSPSGVTEPTGGGGSHDELEVDAPAPFASAAREFREQDQLLRRLDGELSGMLEHLQLASTSMLQVARLFSETLRSEPESHALSAEFLESMERIVRDGVEITEQSIRFTIVDPLVARLERHDQLLTQLTDRERLARECRVLREAVEHTQAPGMIEVDDKCRQNLTKLAALEMELDGLQRELLSAIDDLTHGHGFTNQNDLFAAMRLHLATFFFNANKSLFPRLSPTEMEIVTGASYTDAARRAMSAASQRSSQPSTSSFRLHKMSSVTSEDWSEVDGSASAYEDDSSRPSITLEEFEMGRSPPNLSDILARVEVGTGSSLASSSSKSSGRPVDSDELVARAAHPVVPSAVEDEADTPRRVSSRESGIERMSMASPHGYGVKASDLRSPSMFTSFSKSIRGKLGYQSKGKPSIHATFPHDRSPAGSEGPTDAGFLIVSPPHGAPHSSSRPPRHRAGAAPGTSRSAELSPQEWRAIEACLWDIDARKCQEHKCKLLDVPGAVDSSGDLLPRLFRENEKLAHECVSYLYIEDLVRLVQVNRSLHANLRHCPPMWKQCIRSCDLTHSMRRTVWLAAFYESTPWHSDDFAPHLLPRETRSIMYEQLVLKVGAKLTDAAVRKEPTSEEDAQLLAWMQEIDVDVARTCHRDKYASDTDEEESWDLTSHRSSASSSNQSRANTSSVVAGMSDESASDLSGDTKIVRLAAENRGDDAGGQCSLDGGANDGTLARLSTEATAAAAPQCCDEAQATDKAARRATLETKVRRVLRAYVMYNPRVGYCQGMSFLVRLLADVAEDEADLFWLFVGFSEPENDRNLYEPGLAVLQPFLSKYETLFSTHMPDLYAHFQQEGVHVASFCTRWFMTLFSSFETASPRLATRLLDIFVIDGWRIIFSMALVVLDELRFELSGADLEGILRVLQSPRKYMVEQSASKRRQLLRHALAFSISQMINAI